MKTFKSPRDQKRPKCEIKGRNHPDLLPKHYKQRLQFQHVIIQSCTSLRQTTRRKPPVRGQTSAFRVVTMLSPSQHIWWNDVWLKANTSHVQYTILAWRRPTWPFVPLTGPLTESPGDKQRNKNNSTDRTFWNWIPPASLCVTYVEKYI